MRKLQGKLLFDNPVPISASLDSTDVLVLYVVGYAIENEIDHINEDDIDDILLGGTDEMVDQYIHYSQDTVNYMQNKINAMLGGFFNEKTILPQ